MRILYHHRVGSRDGQAVHIDELIHAFRSLGHEVVVVGPPGFERSAIGEGSPIAASIKRHLPKLAFELAELAYNFPTYFRLRRAMRRARPDLIYERYGLFLVAGSLLSKQTGIPIFLEVNSPLSRERGEFGGLTLGSLAGRLERWTWRSARRVLPVTGVLAELVRAA
ncbi:MAG TPA: glycosyltransferase, partial [Stellaceae bacterium]|nr:glycosyltransferase [Stellaceae bacterium]